MVNNAVYEGGDIAEKCMTCLNGLSTFSAVIAIVIQFITYAMVTKMLTCLNTWSACEFGLAFVLPIYVLYYIF